METKINTNAIPDGGIDIEKLKAGIVPDVSHLETKEVADAIQENETVVDALNAAIGNKANSSDVYNKQEVDDKIDAATTIFQYAASDFEVPAERVPGVVYLVGNEMITFTLNNTSYQAVEGMTWGDWINSEYNSQGQVLKGLDTYIIHLRRSLYIAMGIFKWQTP